ncbi:MAG: class I SAM-dependent methyltransferase [Acidimicrobiales bacterium]
MPWEELVSRLACPVDRSPLALSGRGVACPDGHRYQLGEHGYLEVAPPDSPVLSIDSTASEYASHQESGGPRTYEAYLRGWLQAGRAQHVLDVGCGVGAIVDRMRRDGIDALGVDMRGVADFWGERGGDPAAFVVGDGVALPFPDRAFDAVMALGVIEHVGTLTGHLTLAPDWRDQRRRFADELARITRAGGRILVACPNKWFPVDVQHGPNDQLTAAPWRSRVFERLALNVHATWGAYHLASYADLWSWYGRDRVRPLPLRGYFGFSALERPGVPRLLSRMARAWMDDLPAALRPTPLNPYLLAEITV